MEHSKFPSDVQKMISNIKEERHQQVVNEKKNAYFNEIRNNTLNSDQGYKIKHPDSIFYLSTRFR